MKTEFSSAVFGILTAEPCYNPGSELDLFVMTTTPDLAKVSRIFKRLLPAGYQVLLFGSRATGQARPGSDWDLGILGPVVLRGAIVQSIRGEMEELPTLYSFDITPATFTTRGWRKRFTPGCSPTKAHFLEYLLSLSSTNSRAIASLSG